MARIKVRKGMPSVQLDKARSPQRVEERFYDPAFATARAEIGKIVDAAWTATTTAASRRSPGAPARAYADPDYELSVEWIAQRDGHPPCRAAAQESPRSKSRILLINGSPRSDQTCPGEISKSFRLMEIAERVIERERGFEVERLDLTAHLGARAPHPSLQGLRLDRDAALPLAVLLLSQPFAGPDQRLDGRDLSDVGGGARRHDRDTGHWYQAPTVLKAMIDRLVCADGGNPDPTSTGGKDPQKAKDLEMKGWDYPRHLAGRVFSVVVHGDAAGTENLRRSLVDWLSTWAWSAPATAARSTAMSATTILRHEPSRARCRPRLPGGDAQRRRGAGQGGEADARRQAAAALAGLPDPRPK
jgi:hypothetical protein